MKIPDQAFPELVRILFRPKKPKENPVSAMAARRTDSEPLRTIEWCRGASLFPEHSPVVWRLGPGRDTVEIRPAFRSQNINEFTSCFDVRARLVLGHRHACWSEPVSLQLEGYPPRYRPMTLTIPEQWSKKIGVYDARIFWYYRLQGSRGWGAASEVSHHRVYILTREPIAPWVPSGANERLLPWIEALDYACRWAQGKHEASDICAALEQGLHQLAPDCMKYNPGSRKYVDVGIVHLARFLARLRGGGAADGGMDCTDYACVLVVLAALLGVPLRTVEVHEKIPGITSDIVEINRILGAGWASATPQVAWRHFTVHRFAAATDLPPGVKPNTDNWDKWKVFDAALALDARPPEDALPFAPVLSQGTPLNVYWQRLSAREFSEEVESRPIFSLYHDVQIGAPGDQRQGVLAEASAWAVLDRALPEALWESLAGIARLLPTVTGEVEPLPLLISAHTDEVVEQVRESTGVIKNVHHAIRTARAVLRLGPDVGIVFEIFGVPPKTQAERLSVYAARAEIEVEDGVVEVWLLEYPPLWLIPIQDHSTLMVRLGAGGQPAAEVLNAVALVHLSGRYLAEQSVRWG